MSCCCIIFALLILGLVALGSGTLQYCLAVQVDDLFEKLDFGLRYIWHMCHDVFRDLTDVSMRREDLADWTHHVFSHPFDSIFGVVES